MDWRLLIQLSAVYIQLGTIFIPFIQVSGIYRAMLSERGYATVCRPSVGRSVCLYVCL